MTTLESLGVDVIGLNCSTGPEHMREPVRYLSENATLPLSVIPNAGLPLNTGVGEAVYPLEAVVKSVRAMQSTRSGYLPTSRAGRTGTERMQQSLAVTSCRRRSLTRELTAPSDIPWHGIRAAAFRTSGRAPESPDRPNRKRTR